MLLPHWIGTLVVVTVMEMLALRPYESDTTTLVVPAETALIVIVDPETEAVAMDLSFALTAYGATPLAVTVELCPTAVKDALLDEIENAGTGDAEGAGVGVAAAVLVAYRPNQYS